MDIGIVTRIMNALLHVLSGGYGRTLPEALWLLQRLATLELVLLGIWWALGQQQALATLLSKMLWFGALLWFLTAWPTLSLAFVESLVQVGLGIGGAQITVQEFFDPSAILQQGMLLVSVLVTRITSYSGIWNAAANLPETLLLGFATLGIWCAFFIVAAQIFVKILEFYLVSVVVVILLPFGAFRHTSFLAEKAFAVVIGSGIALAVLAVIASLGLPLIVTFQISSPPTLNDAFTVLGASGLLALLAWHAPALAAGIMAGAPSLQAGTLAHGAVAAGAATLLGAAAIDQAARGLMGATQHATTGVAALGTAVQHGGLGGVAQLAQRAGSDLTAATTHNVRAAAHRGQAYAQAALAGTATPGSPGARGGGSRRQPPGWARHLVQRAIPPQAQPQGGVQVPLDPP